MSHPLKAVTQQCPVVTVRRMLLVGQTLTILHLILRTVTTPIPSLQKAKVREQCFELCIAAWYSFPDISFHNSMLYDAKYIVGNNSVSSLDPWLSLVAEKKPKKRKLNPPKSKSSKSSPKPIASELISRASPTKMETSSAKEPKKEMIKPPEVAAEPNLLKMVTTTNIPASSSHSAAAVRQMKEELLKKVELLSSHLPANTLDQLIDELGGPDCVAEVSYIYYYYSMLSSDCEFHQLSI